MVDRQPIFALRDSFGLKSQGMFRFNQTLWMQLFFGPPDPIYRTNKSSLIPCVVPDIRVDPGISYVG